MSAAAGDPPDEAFSGVWGTALHGLEEGVVVFDAEGRLLGGNPAAERLLGLSAARSRNQGLTDPRWRVVREDGQALGYEQFPAYVCLRSGRAQVATLGVTPPDGPRRWLQVKAQPVCEGETLTHVVVSFYDVTAQREAQARLGRDAHFRGTLLRVVSESLAEGLEASFYGRLLEGAVEAIPGAQAGSLLLREGDRYTFGATVGYDLAALQQAYLLPEELYRGGDGLSTLLVYGFDNHDLAASRRRVIDGAGRAAAIKVSLSIPVVLQSEPVAFISLDNFEAKNAFDDEAVEMGRIFAQQTAALWQRFKLEADMKRLAFYDPLTGLPNRSLLDDRLRQAVARRGRSAGLLAVLFLDLDDFKNVNDTFGHAVGDALLRAVAARLSGVIREGDTLARWSGDEFVLLTELAAPADAAVVAGKLLKALEHPFDVGGRDLRVRGSVGIDLTAEPRRHGGDLIKHADLALYRAKTTGKGTYQFFTLDLKRRLQTRLDLEHDLREALGQGTLTLDYQPRFDLRTGRCTGAEALARWAHPVRGPVRPADFIPVAEETGMIVALGQQMLDQAALQARAWRVEAAGRRVAVNVSAVQLACPGFVGRVEEALARAALGPAGLELEVTESAAMANLDDTVAKLQELRRLGVRVALDDFGTAYSSLTYLKRLPLDVLKLDQSFMRDLGDTIQGQGARLVRAIVELGQSFGLTVVAEGVEAPAQLELLRTYGCHEAQGDLLAPPRSAAALASLELHAALTRG